MLAVVLEVSLVMLVVSAALLFLIRMAQRMFKKPEYRHTEEGCMSGCGGCTMSATNPTCGGKTRRKWVWNEDGVTARLLLPEEEAALSANHAGGNEPAATTAQTIH